ncbi:MAG: hypothetical protein ACYST6_20530 [Planctomycetota bacterium]
MKNSKVLIAALLVGLTTMLLFCPCASALTGWGLMQVTYCL